MYNVRISLSSRPKIIQDTLMVLSSGVVEYTDCLSEERKDFPNGCPGYDTKKIWWWGSNNAGALGDALTPSLQRGKTFPTGALDMTLKNLVVRFQ